MPQLLNILRGDMSLVGPRPVPPDLFAKGDERIRRRTLVRPGMTGLGQVLGRADSDFVDLMNRDLEYVRSWSLWLDFKLMVRTVLVLFRGRT
jgi:lipopolysaccharide/colanic/teichoic acid biosynthesis glycosyltransferase